MFGAQLEREREKNGWEPNAVGWRERKRKKKKKTESAKEMEEEMNQQRAE